MANKLYEETNIQNIANSIREKTGETGTMKVSEMASKIDSIPTGGGDLSEYFNYQPTTITSISASSWFKTNYFKKFENIEIPNNCTNASNVFYDCGAFNVLPGLKGGKNCTYLYNLYYNCSSITSIDISELETDSCENTMSMFYNCKELTEIDLSNCKWTKLFNSREMFNACSGTTKIKFGTGYTTNNLQYTLQMFQGCSSLQELDLGDLDFTNVLNYSSMFSSVPNNCYILCKDEANKNWITSKFTNLTNVHYRGE